MPIMSLWPFCSVGLLLLWALCRVGVLSLLPLCRVGVLSLWPFCHVAVLNVGLLSRGSFDCGPFVSTPKILFLIHLLTFKF